MDLKQFVKDAVRTESIKTEITTNREMFMNISKIFVLSGQMLDLYKKNVFYNRPIKQDVLVDNFRSLADAMTNISNVFKSNSQTENNDTINFNTRLFHAVVGMATESTELMEQMIKSIESKTEPDSVNLLEETFDAQWYAAIMHDELKADMQHTYSCGIDKLRKRFPDKFTDEKANVRDLNAEREILNKMVD